MDTKELSKKIRIESLKMVTRSKASHIASALSCVDIIAVLYNEILKVSSKNPNLKNRDRFILSKGHACVALYAALGIKNFFPLATLKKYGKNNSYLMSHVSHKVPGVEFSTGSLGQGLPFAAGKAYFAYKQNFKWKTYVLLSDGELNEGSNWEALQFIGHHNLKNITIIIDNNKLQGMDFSKKILNLNTYLQKITKLNFDFIELDGHNLSKLKKAFLKKNKKPKFILANTIKGKGLEVMENNNLWHYKNPSDNDLIKLIDEIKAN